MIKKIADKVWKVDVDSNVYFLDLDDKIVIDTGPRAHRIVEEEKQIGALKLKIEEPELDIKEKEKLYSQIDKLEEQIDNKLNEIEDFNGLKVISTPGHTRGSICIWYEKEKVLFTGDTKFKYAYGRTDLPTSAPDKIEESIKKLGNYKYKVLAPGHDY